MGRVDGEGLALALMLLKGVDWDVSPLAAQEMSDFFFPSSDTRLGAFGGNKPLLKFFELLNKKVKVNRVRRVQVVLVCMSKSILLRR